MSFSSKSSGHLKNVKELIFEDAADPDDFDDAEVSANKTYQDELYYFAWLSSHYLCLVIWPLQT
jgi:hypothetical protein